MSLVVPPSSSSSAGPAQSGALSPASKRDDLRKRVTERKLELEKRTEARMDGAYIKEQVRIEQERQASMVVAQGHEQFDRTVAEREDLHIQPLEKQPDGEMRRRWAVGVCGCCEAPGVCVMAMIFPCIVHGQLASIGADDAFCSECCTCCFCPWCTGYAFRRSMRQKYQLRGGFMSDLCTQCLWWPCALAQEEIELRLHYEEAQMRVAVEMSKGWGVKDAAARNKVSVMQRGRSASRDSGASSGPNDADSNGKKHKHSKKKKHHHHHHHKKKKKKHKSSTDDADDDENDGGSSDKKHKHKHKHKYGKRSKSASGPRKEEMK